MFFLRLRKKPKLTRIIEEYLQICRLAPSTVKSTRSAWAQIVQIVGDVRINRFTVDRAEYVQIQWLRHFPSTNTSRIYHKHVSPVFTWAVGKKYIKANPWFEVELPKATKRQVRVYSAAEFTRMLHACQAIGDPLRWTATLMIARTTGMRKSAVQNLTRNEVNFEAGTITIRQKFDTENTWAWQPKDREERTVALVPVVARLVIELLRTIPDAQPYILLKPHRYGHLLQCKHTGRLTDDMRICPVTNFDRIFRKIKKRAAVTGRFHDLRATCLTGLTDSLNWRELMDFAGLSDIKTAMSYIGMGQGVVKRARESVQRALAVIVTPSPTR